VPSARGSTKEYKNEDTPGYESSQRLSHLTTGVAGWGTATCTIVQPPYRRVRMTGV